MIGIKARKPLGDIDVNQSRANVIASKKNANVSLAFKVFADGETIVQKKNSSKDSQPSAVDKTHQKCRNSNVLDDVKDDCKSFSIGKRDPVSVADVTTSKQASDEERITQQLAMMLFETLEKKPQAEVNSPKLIVCDEKPVVKSKLNVEAKEWYSTSGVATNKIADEIISSNQRFKTVFPNAKEYPLFGELQATATHSNGLFSTPTHGRKITGRPVTPTLRTSPLRPSTPATILSELDDRSAEIQRFLRYKEARRQKAIEAMRVEQERQTRRVEMLSKAENATGVRSSSVKESSLPGDIYAARTQYGNRKYQRKPIVVRDPSTSVTEIVRSQSGCTNLYPTEPFLPIRYQPEDILNLNYLKKDTKPKADVKKIQEKPKKRF
uniref:Uncharacterized protein n=1 Tax=Anopheles farauti TaxID=69004 RepID=A0A182QP05_9DIPT